MKSKIRFEPPHVKREVMQCQNCQRYGHSKNYCHRSPRCVKCAGDHLTKNCERKTKSKDVKCINCQGNHPANYRGCIVAKEIQKRKYPPLRPRQLGANTQYVQPGVSYAQQTNTNGPDQITTTCNPQSVQTTSQQQTETKLEMLVAKLMERMDTMLNLLTAMITKMNNNA